MARISRKEYDNCDDFKKNKRHKKSKGIQIFEPEMVLCAARLGNFSGHGITKKGMKFYDSLLDMALKITKKGHYAIGCDYRNAEPSIRSSISFFMGMVAAEILAEKKYDIPYLFHLSDRIITDTSAPKHPDFFGINKKGKGVLIEAKGTSEKVPRNSTVEYAKGQLESVMKVTTEQGNNYTELERYVIASSFGQKDKLTCHCIGIKPEGNGEIKIDLDKAIILYYRSIMKLIQSDLPTKDEKIGSKEYAVSDLGPYKIGLDKEILNGLQKYEKSSDPDSLKCVYEFMKGNDSSKEVSSSDKMTVRSNGTICILNDQ